MSKKINEIELKNVPEIIDIMIYMRVNYTTDHVYQLDNEKEIEIGGLIYEIVGSFTNDDNVTPENDVVACLEVPEVLTKTYILKLKRIL
ncbi:hypothetical protein ABKP49_000989 [Escherichia coli]